jgi:hypothetical protein
MSAPRPNPARVSWARPRLGIADALGAIFSLAVASLSFLYPYGRDQAAFAYVAREWGLGNVPFKTVFEIKPPSIYLTYLCAFRLFGDHPAAIRLMDYFGAVVPTAIACAYASTPVREGPRRGRIGLALALVSVVYYLPFDFWSTAQCESFCSMFSVLAACAALRSERSMRAGFFVGLWSTMAVLFKPTVAIVAIGNALVLALALHSRKASRSDYLKSTVAMTVGIVAPVVVLFAYFGAKGALGPMHEALVVTNRQYLLAGRYVHGAEETSRAVLFGIFGFQALLILCGNVLVFRGAHVLRWRPREEALPYVAAGMGLLTSVASVIVQLKFFTYHWVSTVGFVAMTLVVVAGDLDRGQASRHRGAVLGAVVALGLLVTGGRQSMRLFYTAKTAVHLRQTGDDEPLAKSFAIENYYSFYDSRETARWVKDHASQGDTLVVRGFEPVIYMESGLRYGGRFFESTWITQKRFSTLTGVNAIEDYAFFKANPPRWVVAFSHLDTGIDAAKTYESMGYVRRTNVAVFSILERGPVLKFPEEMPW